jgi:hypothetical protein
MEETGIAKIYDYRLRRKPTEAELLLDVSIAAKEMPKAEAKT